MCVYFNVSNVYDVDLTKGVQRNKIKPIFGYKIVPFVPKLRIILVSNSDLFFADMYQ